MANKGNIPWNKGIKFVSDEISKKKRNEYLKSYRKTEKFKKYDKKYRQTEKRRKYSKEYQKSEKYKEQQRNYKKTSNKFIERRREYQKIKRMNDIQYKISSLIRSRLSKIIKRNSKSGSAVKDLGCSVNELKIYLENRFVNGMGWENQGRWQIDHIIPLSSFDLTNRDQFLKAVHYTNLQPLWALENQIKSNKIYETFYR